MRWDNETDGVFVGRDGQRVAARVVRELKSWEWASYKGGWTHDCGQEQTFAAACEAAEKSVQSISN
jgi:hypothetical protein